MLELGIGADLVRGIGLVLWGLLAVALLVALFKPKTITGKVLCSLLVLCIFFGPMVPGAIAAHEYRQKYEKAKALFDERCKTAGEKIYRTVEGVEGIRLSNIRKSDVAGNSANQNWDEAGLPKENTGDGYIKSFLYWEQHQDKRNPRGYLSSYPSDLPGFNFVEAPAGDGQYITYTLDKSDKDNPKLLTAPLSKSPARYAISSKNISTAEDTAQWIAGVSIEVTDTKTNELMAKGVWYAFERGFGDTSGFRQPWGYAVTCPSWFGWDSARTRFFVDQILKPNQGK